MANVRLVKSFLLIITTPESESESYIVFTTESPISCQSHLFATIFTFYELELSLQFNDCLFETFFLLKT